MLFTFHHHGRAFAIETAGFAGRAGDPHEAADHLAEWIEAHSPTQTGLLHTVLAATQDEAARSYRIAELDEAAAAIAAALAATLDGHEAAPGQLITLRAAMAEQITTREARELTA
jgi:hypothetical protein